MNIEELKATIRKANETYRSGDLFSDDALLLTDEEFDTLVEQLRNVAPDDDLLTEIGHKLEETDVRKQRLPIPMASMNKVKTIQDLSDWIRLKEIPLNTTFIITPKYDGCSLCTDEIQAASWTRGDGEFGQRSDEHFNKMNTQALNEAIHTFGEVIMKRNVFNEKYSEVYVNARNMVAGLMNTKEASPALEDCEYVRYGAVGKNFSTKSELIDFLNNSSAAKIKVPYEICTFESFSEEYLKSLYFKWSEDFELDGVIIEINDSQLCDELGRETGTNNPCYARAYKGNFEEVKETTITGCTFQISKQGLMKPVLHVDPIKLDGATVSNITGNNAGFMRDMKLGIGAKIMVKRSGMVIPLVVSVTEPVEPELPSQCPCCNEKLKWNKNKIELVCENIECEAQVLKRIISFFEILGVDNVGEGVCAQLYNAGYNTIRKILTMTVDDMLSLEGFGERKASIVYDNIHSKMQNVELPKLQHATGFFRMLGSKKLALVQHFIDIPTMEQLISVEGFSEISAKDYLNGINRFNDFIKDLPITIKPYEAPAEGEFSGKTFVFTGFRDKNLEHRIESKGGKVGSGVSKKTHYLVMAAKNSGSSKERKAQELGVIILDKRELEEML